MKKQTILTGIIVEETTVFTIGGLSRACGKPAEWILALIEEGVIEPVVENQNNLIFHGHCLRKIRIAEHLVSDLRLNLPGAALALELLEEIDKLRNRIALLEK